MFFYGAYLVYLASMLLVKTTISNVIGDSFFDYMQLMRYAAYALLALSLLMRRHELKQVFIVVVLAIVGFICLGGSNATLLVALFFMYGALFVDIKKLMKYSFYLMMSTLLLVCFFAMCDVIPMVFEVAGDHLIFALGFSHPNNASIYYLALMMLALYVWRVKAYFMTVVNLTLVSIALFWITGSRTGFFGALIFIILFCVFQKMGGTLLEKRIFRTGLIWFVPICAVSFIWATYNFGHIGWLDGVNDFLTNRLYWAHNAFELYGVGLRGNSVDLSSTASGAYNVVDSSYARDLIQDGFIVYVLFIGAYSFLMRYAMVQKDYILICGILAVAIVSLSENFLAAFPINPWIVMMGLYFNLSTGKREASNQPSVICEGDNKWIISRKS